jgi:hypothetical protein
MCLFAGAVFTLPFINPEFISENIQLYEHSYNGCPVTIRLQKTVRVQVRWTRLAPRAAGAKPARLRRLTGAPRMNLLGSATLGDVWSHPVRLALPLFGHGTRHTHLLRSGFVSHLSPIRNLAAFDLPSSPAQIIKAMHAHPNTAAVQPRWRAVLRLALGQAQIIGATITLVFLLQGGVCARAIWGVILTGLVSLVTILLFRLVWREKPKV